MADAATKHHFSVNGASFLSELKYVSGLIRTRKSVAFAYGFIFAFVAFTVFLAFSPSANSTAPWFTNIFSTPTASSDSYGSHFSSIFSYIYPNNTQTSSPSSLQQQQQEQPRESPSLPAQNTTTTTRSNATALSQPPKQNPEVKSPPTVPNNNHDGADDSVKPTVLPANQLKNASTINKQPESSSINTQNTRNSNEDQALKPNQTAIVPPKAPVAANQATSVNSTTETVSLMKGNSETQGKGSGVKIVASNYTASLLKKQSNGAKQSNSTDSGVSKKQGIESLVQNLMNCDLFDGTWVRDDSYPLYKPGSCSLIDEQFNCIDNGRPDKDYQKYKWKPNGCILPRLNAGHMLELLRGKRLVFVGDSLNRNMWESLVCILKGAVKDQSKVFEANGRSYFRGEAQYSFIFKDYGTTIEFFVSPFLVREWVNAGKNGSKETLRLDLVGKSSDQYKNADIILFNTGHWWTHDKTSLGKDYYQEGSHVYSELNVLEAFRKAMTTWARWVDKNVNPLKSLVLFRGYSHSHFSGGQWNSGGACDSEVEPINNATYLREYPDKMVVLEKVLRGMKTRVTYLNVTRMTDYRKDGHPSIYRKQKITEEERKKPMLYQDCSHWCLPGVPDAWNEILYAELLINERQKQQAQKRHR